MSGAVILDREAISRRQRVAAWCDHMNHLKRINVYTPTYSALDDVREAYVAGVLTLNEFEIQVEAALRVSTH